MIKKANKLKKINERKEKELKSIINYNDDDDVDEIEEHITKKQRRKELYTRKKVTAKKKL